MTPNTNNPSPSVGQPTPPAVPSTTATTATNDSDSDNSPEERPTHTSEIGTLKKLPNHGTAWLGSSSGVYFVNTVRRAFPPRLVLPPLQAPTLSRPAKTSSLAKMPKVGPSMGLCMRDRAKPIHSPNCLHLPLAGLLSGRWRWNLSCHFSPYGIRCFPSSTVRLF